MHLVDKHWTQKIDWIVRSNRHNRPRDQDTHFDPKLHRTKDEKPKTLGQDTQVFLSVTTKSHVSREVTWVPFSGGFYRG